MSLSVLFLVSRIHCSKSFLNHRIYFICLKDSLGGQGAADRTRDMICSIEALRGKCDPTPLVGPPGRAIFTEADIAALHMAQKREALQLMNQDRRFLLSTLFTVHNAASLFCLGFLCFHEPCSLVFAFSLCIRLVESQSLLRSHHPLFDYSAFSSCVSHDCEQASQQPRTHAHSV